jgi:hypothetical protein
VEELKKFGIRGPYLKAFIGWTQTNNDELEDTYASVSFPESMSVFSFI